MYQTCRISWQEVTRSDKYSVLSYVVFSFSSALTARSLRAQHHISGKTTFRTGLPPWVINEQSPRAACSYTVEPLGHAYPAQCPARVLLSRVPLGPLPWLHPTPRPGAQVCSPASVLL